MAIEEPFCPDCGKGSDYIISDATAQWDVSKQEWELCDVNDAYICSNCDTAWLNHKKWREVTNA